MIELLVGLVLLAIVLGGWFTICNFQAIRKEALRRVAVEKAAGMLDFMARETNAAGGYCYRVVFDETDLVYRRTNSTIATISMFGAGEPIGYCLRVTTGAQVVGGRTGTWAGTWAVIDLCDKVGIPCDSKTNPAFSSMSVLIKR